MSGFPVSFTDNSIEVDSAKLDVGGQQALAVLHDKGYKVLVGLTSEYAEAIKQMSLEPSIQAYCPNDKSKRFTDEAAAQAWLTKGRCVFLLVGNQGDEKLAGYGWSGYEHNEHIPDGKTTFALRVGEASQGQGLASPYAQVILSATKALYDADKFWLETWASNGGAVHVYHKLGFEQVDEVASERPLPDGTTAPDSRLYMTLAD